ncbi:hypothetical protein SPOG_02485 [Schizosaccharomyces cryophilus OY26]|uniref:Uncharacterized protein n=1 Tax=Schizosaccharomyces cryophilus (strain OY26 / ATCC MYA-4695 / CBS 11777 / NBRC 106824 / NRRL Y48691) TaxID=653667 RepID=S9XBV0_SCHCR|nr:uncharacterized protein SPOG_02485 [Schizosaccharomyces cryophilus OY26]EPY51311.1 hypothetical protein SPOG_02485 [Schizosaccharomyces cryophilus OY26]
MALVTAFRARQTALQMEWVVEATVIIRLVVQYTTLFNYREEQRMRAKVYNEADMAYNTK